MKLMSARSSRAPAPQQHREARARHPRRALEVEDAERRPQVPVRLRLEVERRRLAVAAHFEVVGRALAHRHARVRQVRQRHQQRSCAAVRPASSWISSCLICCAARLVGGKDRPTASSPCRFARATSSPAYSARASALRSRGSAGAGALRASRSARDRRPGRGRDCAGPRGPLRCDRARTGVSMVS